MDSRELRNVFGQFATGVTVVSCLNEASGPHGATVNAFTAVSLEPALAQVTLARAARACQFLEGKPFAVNILASDQVDVAWHFAGHAAATEPEWREGPTAPLIAGTAASISCVPWRSYDGGDHLIVIGEVVATEIHRREPLLFHGGAFRHLGEVEAVHWKACGDAVEAGWFDAATSFAPFPHHAVGNR